MKVGNIVTVIDKEKEQWAKHNPWMYSKWGLFDKYIVLKSLGVNESLWEVLNIQTNETNIFHSDNLEVVSESR